jgi:AcrR family transcriptional regulator
MSAAQRDGVPLDQHIALVAAGLFYREGINVVGVDRVAAAASITKRTLYRHYPSKDALIAAAIRRAPKIRFPKDGTPRELVLGAFRALIDFVENTAYRGCPYIIVAAELTDRNHPARLVVEELTRRRRLWFRERAAELHAPDAELLAEQLDVLFDGALASAAKRSDSAPAQAAMRTAEMLIDMTTHKRKGTR